MSYVQQKRPQRNHPNRNRWRLQPATKDSSWTVSKIITFLLLVVLAVLTFFPFYWMYVLMTHNSGTIFSAPPPLWFGDQLRNNWQTLFSVLPFGRNMLNSVIIASVATATSLMFNSLGGYALAMYDFKFKRVMFAIIMVTFLIPPILNLIPFAITMRLLGWINDPWFKGLWVPGMASAFGIFFMRQFFASSMSKELMDAGSIDGASEFRIFWSIGLPLVRPGLATLGLITFIGSWNSFLFPLIIYTKRELYPVPLAIRSIQGTAATTDWSVVVLSSALAVTPLLIVFFLASRQIIEGLSQGAVKG
jgi:multiple sugar transport system permease protein